jgi:hypothetical protein
MLAGPLPPCRVSILRSRVQRAQESREVRCSLSCRLLYLCSPETTIGGNVYERVSC